MKLVELLAREITEWPKDGFKVRYLTQDGDGWIASWEDDGPLIFAGDHWKIADSCPVDQLTKEDLAEDHKESIITRAQWQAERDRQKGGEWKRHRGGKCPVDAGQKVGYKFRGGDQGECLAGHLMWDHQQDESDVMKYRVISQPQAEEVEVNKFCTGEKCSATAENIAHSQQCQLEHEMAYTGFKIDQIDGPIKWRDTIIHCQAIIEDCEREIQRNEQLLGEEGFALVEPAISVWQSTPALIPFAEWQVGDIVEVINTSSFANSSVKVGD